MTTVKVVVSKEDGAFPYEFKFRAPGISAVVGVIRVAMATAELWKHNGELK